MSTIAVIAHVGRSFGAGLGELRQVPDDAGFPRPLWCEVARPRDHASRTFAEWTAVDEGVLVHADVEHTGLGVLQVQAAGPGAAIGIRMTIEQATGLLMASLGCDAKQASRALLQISWDQDTPIHDVAAALVAAAQNPRTPATATESAATAISRATRDSSTVGSHHGTDKR